MRTAISSVIVHHEASSGQGGPIHTPSGRPLDDRITQAPTRQALGPFQLAHVVVVMQGLYATLLRVIRVSGFHALRGGEVSALARTQGEGTNDGGRLCGHAINGERKRAECRPCVSRASADVLFIQGFKIQFQGRNLLVITATYRAKCEEWGGIGETSGGVAGGIGRGK